FDTFFCDPTESLRGFLAFAGRGISALRGPGSAGYMGLTRREASLSKWRAIQKELISSGAAITDIRDDFHDYVNWPYIETMRAWGHLPVKRVPGRDEPWYRSALIRIELVEPPRVENVRLEGDIFTDPEAATT
ncbi:MAG TPA: putative methyltransferase, partial [Candidatus Acetothermia bacterium]|nr:putative methyltransferase [Candidatus Acetothermia bacterium]